MTFCNETSNPVFLEKKKFEKYIASLLSAEFAQSAKGQCMIHQITLKNQTNPDYWGIQCGANNLHTDQMPQISASDSGDTVCHLSSVLDTLTVSKMDFLNIYIALVKELCSIQKY